MKRGHGLVLFAAIVALVGCDAQAERVAFCDLISSPPLFDRYVRVQAVGIFSDHGAVLVHPDCPGASVPWDESDAFEGDPSSEALSRAINDLRFDFSIRSTPDPEALSVDVTAHYRWRNFRPALVADEVHTVQRAPWVYASELERQWTRCEMGPYTLVDPEQTRAACAAYEELSARAKRD